MSDFVTAYYPVELTGLSGTVGCCITMGYKAGAMNERVGHYYLKV